MFSLQNTLQNSDNSYLHKRKITDSDRCTFCKTEKETIKHLLGPLLGLHLHLKYVLEWQRGNGQGT